METTIQKTIIFGIFIILGLILKFKFTDSSEIKGIKKIILNLALPATIFIALMGIEVDKSLLGLPIMALVINLLLFYAFPFILPLVGFKKNTADYRTMRLMIPSLAPGLSCFPFITEILGQEYLAKAAMADLGNKVFVLIILYSIAVHWYFRKKTTNKNQKSKLKSLFITLFSEPVTLLIFIALVLLGFGFSFSNLPSIAQEVLQKLSVLMTPLVMLFIGLAVKIRKDQCIQLLSVLLIRAGIVLFSSVGIIWILQISVQNDILWILAFSLSACSFWPYAHMASISEKEKKELGTEKTFRGSLSINILALSFPLSTLMIIIVMLNPSYMTIPINIIVIASICIGFGIILALWVRLRKTKTSQSTIKFSKIKWLDYKKV